MLSEKTPSKNIRMIQAQEAVNRIKVNTYQESHRMNMSYPLGNENHMLT